MMTEQEAIAIAEAEFEIGQTETPLEKFQRTGAPTAEPPMPEQFRNLPSPPGSTPAGQQPEEPAPYDYHALGMRLPDALQPIGDLVANANYALATGLSLPVDLVDSVMKDLGTSGFLDNPGDARKALIKALESHGVAADKARTAEGIFSEIGEATGQNLLMLSMFLGAAPAMLARQGTGAIANFTRELGNMLVRHPGTAATAEIGAATMGEVGARGGGAVGGNLFGETGARVGEQLGGIAGAMGGGALPFAIPLATGKMVSQGINVGRQVARATRQAGDTAPLVSQSSPDTDLIAQAIKSDQIKADRIIDRISKRLTQDADPIEATRELQRANREAYTQTRGLETTYWNKVDQKRRMGFEEFKQWTKNKFRTTVKEGRSEWLPADIIAKIRAMPKKGTLERMRAIRTLLFQRLQSGTVPTPQGVLPVNDKLRANMNEMIAEIDNQIGKAFPNDKALQEARAFSTWLHDRFTRGPLAQFSRPRAKAGTLPDPEQAARSALRNETFGEQQQDLATVLQRPDIEAKAEQFLRGQLAQELEGKSPHAAQKWLKRPLIQSYIKNYPKLAADIDIGMDRLMRASDLRNQELRGAFIKTAGEAPETAINKIITSTNKIANAKTLYNRLKYDPDALKAAQDQLVIELERVAGNDPTRVLQILDGKDVRAAAGIILRPTNMARLERIAREASSNAATEKGIPRFLLRKTNNIAGAWIARKIGSGTLQAPQTGAKLAEMLVDSVLSRADNAIFSKAVRSPAWEAILHAKIPETMAEAKRLNKLLKRAIRLEEAVERTIKPVAEDILGDE